MYPVLLRVPFPRLTLPNLFSESWTIVTNPSIFPTHRTPPFKRTRTAHHGDNNNWGEYNTVEEVISAAQNRAKVASRTMPDCLGGGIGASSPVWMRDYSQPNDKEPKNPKARAMIGA
jgi:hypothetical protein